jgi:lipopolysaccharide transport system ATP-binding protein
MTIAISVENLSKAYQIGQIGTSTISRDLERWWATKVMGKEDPFLKLGQTNDRTVKGDTDVVWSLKDLNLEVDQGDAVGIIGRNGAGKSTLLKLLSRVTSPTTGSIKIKGRVSSLLEVGTGFHPELTGRENIYLNGSILGMRKKEIDRKLDEIVDFSGVERYIDTPVKRYSSGMSVRLAFAVAAHLESEVLIIDEVLAVGDAEFQKKCLGKMEEIGQKDGRTILFVSHNMSAIHALCNRGILIDSGRLVHDGKVVDCVSKYSEYSNGQNSLQSESDVSSAPLKIFGIRVNDGLTPVVRTDQSFEITVNIQANEITNPKIILLIHNSAGLQIVHSRIFCKDIGLEKIGGLHKLRLSMPTMWLTPGIYSIYFKFLVSDFNHIARTESERIMLEVTDNFDNANRGVLLPKIIWTMDKSKIGTWAEREHPQTVSPITCESR